jgi:hypothetical protein
MKFSNKKNQNVGFFLSVHVPTQTRKRAGWSTRGNYFFVGAVPVELKHLSVR